MWCWLHGQYIQHTHTLRAIQARGTWETWLYSLSCLRECSTTSYGSPTPASGRPRGLTGSSTRTSSSSKSTGKEIGNYNIPCSFGSYIYSLRPVVPARSWSWYISVKCIKTRDGGSTEVERIYQFNDGPIFFYVGMIRSYSMGFYSTLGKHT